MCDYVSVVSGLVMMMLVDSISITYNYVLIIYLMLRRDKRLKCVLSLAFQPPNDTASMIRECDEICKYVCMFSNINHHQHQQQPCLSNVHYIPVTIHRSHHIFGVFLLFLLFATPPTPLPTTCRRRQLRPFTGKGIVVVVAPHDKYG